MATVTMLGSMAPTGGGSVHASDHGAEPVAPAFKRASEEPVEKDIGTAEKLANGPVAPSSSQARENGVTAPAQKMATMNASHNGTTTGADGVGPPRPYRSQYAVVLVLSPLNGSFERKSLIVPFAPEVLKLGRQTNSRTVPAPNNGYFDSRVLSRQHAEVWADRQTGRVWIKDSQSSNGTYINDKRLSSDNAESDPHELKKNDILELGIDITTEDGVALLHRKISAKVERISIMSLSAGPQHLSMIAPPGVVQSSVDGPVSHIAKKPAGPASTTKMRRLCIPSGASAPMALGGGAGAAAKAAGMERLDFALFGDVDTTLEDLILSYTNGSGGIGGPFTNSSINTTLAFEHAIKQLVAQIHAVRVDAAKVQSVSSLLQEIRRNQKKSSVLSSLSNQLAVKDAYIAELERKVAERDDLEAQLKHERSRADALDKENKRLKADTGDTPPSAVVAALAAARADIEFYAKKARAAEDSVQQSAETIEDLLRTIDMLKDTPSKIPLSQTSSINDIHGPAQRPRSRTVGGSTQRPRPNNSAATVSMRTHSGKDQSPITAAILPISTAVGVVVVGISVLSLLNCFSRSAK
jgi:pSer/pThr/pTyr-binding forkhead associated (FHA) protein